LISDFPLIHSHPSITREVVNGYSLLYTVKGTLDREGNLPYLLASHLDVVPAENTDAWEVPPFSGKVVNHTYVYGRGAMDDKTGVMVRIHESYRTFFPVNNRFLYYIFLQYKTNKSAWACS